MHRRICRHVFAFAATTIAVITLAVADPAHAQSSAPRVEGLVHHYTADLDTNGPWQIVGDWALTLNPATFTVDLVASFSMVRSDTTPRSPHTHHIRIPGAQITPIVNGYRFSGTAVILNNGVTAPFSGSPATVDLTGGSGMQFANFAVTFGGAAAAHFGTAPVLGVVSAVR